MKTISESVFKSPLFRQIATGVFLVALLMSVLITALTSLFVTKATAHEQKIVEHSITLITSDQVKRAILVEDYAQLHSFVKLIVETPSLDIQQIKVFISGEEQAFVIFPNNLPEMAACKTRDIPIVINELAVGRMNICYNDFGFSSSFSDLSKDINYVLFAGFLIMMLFSLWIILRHLSRINNIANAIQSYSQGNNHIQIEVDNHNELGRLELFFNQMVKAINKSQQEIRQIAFYNSVSQLPNVEQLKKDLENDQRDIRVNVLVIDDYDNLKQTFGKKHACDLIKLYVSRVQSRIPQGKLYHLEDDVILVLDALIPYGVQDQLVGQVTLRGIGSETNLLEAKGGSFTLHLAKEETVNTILRLVRYFRKESQRFVELDESSFERVLLGYQIAENLLQGNTNGLRAYAQIIYPVDEEEWPHLEFLVRYECINGEVLSPFAFLGQIAELGAMAELDRFMLEEAAYLIEDSLQSNRKLQVFVNLTPATLFSNYFYGWLGSHIADPVLKKRIVFEINEAFFLDASAETINVCNRINKAGFKLALDDFGSGFSSYSLLSQLPLSYLKIDRSMILAEGEKADKVLASISSLAKSLGLITIDEGVETEAQYQRVISHGFDQIQGFLLDRPGPVNEKIEKILHVIEKRNQQNK